MASAQLSARGLSVFSESVLKLLGDTGESDITLICGGQIFHSFKVFLSISSGKFAEIFDNDKNIRTVEIPDVHPDILELMLQYIYSAKLDDLDMSTAPQLYEAAAIYDVFPLKRLCGSYIIRHLREENVCKVIFLASKYTTKEDKHLLNGLIYFVTNNEEFLDSNYWKVFARTHKSVAKKFLECLK